MKARTLLARYLVEDNSEDFVHFDECVATDLTIIRSVLKKCLGGYSLLEESEEERLRAEVR